MMAVRKPGLSVDHVSFIFIYNSQDTCICFCFCTIIWKPLRIALFMVSVVLTFDENLQLEHTKTYCYNIMFIVMNRSYLHVHAFI